jgi:hypothetical protein
MVIPKPRNAVDSDTAPWNGTTPDFLPVSKGWPTVKGNWWCATCCLLAKLCTPGAALRLTWLV